MSPFGILTLLSAGENFVETCRREIFKTFMFNIWLCFLGYHSGDYEALNNIGIYAVSTGK